MHPMALPFAQVDVDAEGMVIPFPQSVVTFASGLPADQHEID